MYKHLSSAFTAAAVTLCLAATWTILDRLDHTFSAHHQVSVNGALKSDRLMTASQMHRVARHEKTDLGGHRRPVQVAERKRKSDFLVVASLPTQKADRILASAERLEFAPAPKPEKSIIIASIEPLVFVPVSAGHARRSNVAAESPGTSRLSP